MLARSPSVKLLQCEVDADEESYFRLLLNGKHIKYLTITAGLFSSEDMCFEPSLLSLLPPFPRGDWNSARLIKDAASGNPVFNEVERKALPSACASDSLWHPFRAEYIQLTMGERLCSNIRGVSVPGFADSVVVKFARFWWEVGYIEQEAAAYQWLEGHDIGPRFLGHVTEEGRVIGFLLEKIDAVRHAGPGDEEACSQVLRRLHKLGMLHGDINRHNFLITADGVKMIDFETTLRCSDKARLEEEVLALPGHLADTSGRGGSYVVVE